ncbi:hypothetical protein Pan153_17890 [Gimesia panareensis]|uniref:Knr4/Smi1-like domain-containing protein n=1 Tax=Gimesia panareensis TaxID=2527978 RepID=A0A518FLB9_9PLAN|nr:SMI1/KNR4 family protein [Gimesia panareensis]QDT27585.1 hypothetical protein Enr10x_29030 [Gimesia panareensis]QDV17154.1 hypothetical protein Pan153_17890 [Gimesia panareensis]
MSLPDKVVNALSDPAYHRQGNNIEAVLGHLDVTPSSEFTEFYSTYFGPFWSNSLGIELADIREDECNIGTLTEQCRSQYGFPERMLVLTQLSPGGTVHVLDTESDEVFVVDFEGGEDLLIKGELEPRWETFSDFLQDYF